MKALKALLAISLAALLFAGCKKDDAPKNSITFDGKTYTDMDVYYRLEGRHMFWLLVEVHADIEIHGAGQVDTPLAFGEDLKGGTVNFDPDSMDSMGGYGDVIAMSLLMICLNLHAKGKGKEDGAKEHTPWQ